MERRSNRTYKFAEFELDPGKRLLLRGGNVVALFPKAFDLLQILVERRGEVLSKDELLDTVWDGRIVEEGNLTVNISHLRKALGQRGDQKQYIVTIPGKGYSFVAEVAEHESLSERWPDIDEPIELPESEPIVENSYTEQPPLVKRAGLFGRILGSRVPAVVASLAVIAAFGFAIYLLKTWLDRPFPYENPSVRQLTSRGKITQAGISPDGKLFAYAVTESDYETLWLGHIDGSAPIKVGPSPKEIYQDVSFSADGSSIIYRVTSDYGNGGYFRIPVLGGVAEKIYGGPGVISFAPDGQRFASMRTDTNQGKVKISAQRLDGTEKTELISLPLAANESRHTPAWSPDGSLIAHIHSVSPNASFVELADIKQNSYWRLTSFSWEYLRCLKWLRDGSGLIAVGKQNNSVYNQLWFISYPSGEVRRISWDLNDYAFSTSVSDDGSILALSGVTQSNIWLGQADDLGRSRQVTFDANGRNAGWWGLAWTPQDQILYAANIGEGTSIFTMNTDGSEQRQLIPTGAINNYPSVTADGKTLVFQSNRGGHFAVWKANIDGSNMKQISGDSVAGQPSVSPDGKWVVYTSHVENTGDLWRIPLGGGDPSLLAKGAGWSAVSPDSRFVACLLTKPKESLSILSIDDGSVISSFEVPKLANLRLGVRWSPDGKSIAYRDWTNGIWLQPVSGGEPRRLEGIPEEKLFAFGWSADGKQFAYTRGSTLQDIVLITPEK